MHLKNVFSGLAALLALSAGAMAQGQNSAAFYPMESFTIVYQSTGMMSGTSTMHVRDHGRQMAKIDDMTVSVGNMTVPQKSRTVTMNGVVVTIDDAKHTGTRLTIPNYEEMMNAYAQKPGLEAAYDMIKAMGGAPSGATKTIAGENCDVWTIPSLGTEMCLSSDGLTLATSVTMGPMSMSQEATEVRRDDGGPDEAFSLDGIAITDFTMPHVPGMPGQQ